MAKVNARHMEGLGFSPFEIMYGYLPVGDFEVVYPSSSLNELRAALSSPSFMPPQLEDLGELIVNHMARIEGYRKTVHSQLESHKTQQTAVHSGREPRVSTHDLAMLCQDGKTPKLQVGFLHVHTQLPIKSPTQPYCGVPPLDYQKLNKEDASINNQLPYFRQHDGCNTQFLEGHLPTWQSERESGRVER